MDDYDEIAVEIEDPGKEAEPGEEQTAERRFPRFNTTMYACALGESEMIECRGNFSAGGFCFEYEQRMKPCSLVDALIRLPGAGLWVRARGKVLGCIELENSVGIRCEFLEVDSGDTGFLLDWLQSIRHLRRVA